MIYLDQSAVNLILPSIQRDLNIALSDMQWILSIYILFTTSFLLLCGVVGDRFGRVRVYMLGMICYGIAALGCGLAQSLGQLLFARALQGLGSAMIVAVGLAILNANTEKQHRATAIGSWAGLSAMIIAIGPTLAGYLTTTFSWKLVFLINVPFALIALLIAKAWVPENSRDTRQSRIDWFSSALLLTGMGSLLVGIIESARQQIPGVAILLLLIVGIGALFAFMRRQLAHQDALIPRAVFRYPRFIAINLVTLCQWMAISGVFYFLPINLQWVQGYSVLEAGMSFLPISISVMICSRWSGRLSDRHGPLWPMLASIVCMAAAMLWFALATSLENYLTQLLPITILYGIGLGMVIAPITTVAMNALPDQYSGIASGVNNSASRVANMLAVAFMGSLMAWVFRLDLAHGLAVLGIDQATTELVMGQASRLANINLTGLPGTASTGLIKASIDHAIAQGFSLLMLLSALISVFSLGIIYSYQRGSGTAHKSFWVVD